jgi:hypothetical protein
MISKLVKIKGSTDFNEIHKSCVERTRVLYVIREM